MLVEPDENPFQATTASPASLIAASGGKIDVFGPSLYGANGAVKPPVALPRNTSARPVPAFGVCTASTASPERFTASFGLSCGLAAPVFTSPGWPNDDAPVGRVACRIVWVLALTVSTHTTTALPAPSTPMSGFDEGT